MGIFNGEEKVVVVSYYPPFITLGRLDCLHFRLGNCTFCIYIILVIVNDISF